jgi:hypothetical protein
VGKHFINYEAAYLFWLSSWGYSSHFSFMKGRKCNVPDYRDYLKSFHK